MGVGEFLIWSGVLGLVFYTLRNIFTMVKFCLKESSIRDVVIGAEIDKTEFDTSDFKDI